MSSCILIIDDDDILNDQLLNHLADLGYAIDVATNGEDGLSQAMANHYQLILLDIRLPRRDGLSVLTELRRHKQTPVMLLTASNTEQDRILGFQAGADDYLAKPFNVTELCLRIEAILRRTSPAQLHGGKAHAIALDPFSFTVRINNSLKKSEVVLTPLEFDLLSTLVDQQDEVLSKTYLYQQVLKRNFCQYDRTLDMHVSKIRKKFNASGIVGHVIKTVRGQGYCYDSQSAL